jgi:hypothetical protein
MSQLEHMAIAFIIQQIIFHCFLKNAEFMREENEKWQNRIDHLWNKWISKP